MPGEAKPEPVLDSTDLNSRTWMKIKAHLEERLATHRALNDTDKSPDKTAKLRGRIAEDKYVLSLGSPVPLMEVDTSD